MRYLSLFSGIEAASVAWHPLGWTPVAFAEIEPFPSAVLAERFPGVPNFGDVSTFKEWNIDGTIDLIVGGSPCQSFSVAGLRKGLDDPRGNLALTYLAIVDKYRPEWIVWENVPGVLSSNRGRDFGSFLGALDEIGYGYAWRVLDAQYVRTPDYPRAVPQRRRRVFVVGNLRDAGRAAAVLFDSESLLGNPTPRRTKRQNTSTTFATSPSGNGSLIHAAEVTSIDARYKMDRGDTGQNSRMIVEAVCYETNPTDARCSEIKDGVGPTVKARWGTGGNNQALVQQVNYGVDMYNGVVNDEVAVSVTSRTGIPDATGPRLMEVDEVQELSSQLMQVRRLTPLECERLQGFPDNWTQIPWRKKAAEDCPDGPRYKAIGNSMAVNVMQWIGIRIAMVKEICDDQD